MKRKTQPAITRRRKDLKVLNRLGLHARPAAEFVRCVLGFRSEIRLVTEDGRQLSANRILEVLLADLSCGAKFSIEAEGPDADAAVDRIERLMEELCSWESEPIDTALEDKDRPD
jgi:phosphotransferase system HPr (HPr) family protein